MLLPLIALALLAWIVRSYLSLRHIPGPFFASLTNLPRLLWVLKNKAHDVHIDLHRKYGDLVRIGPNVVSIADPAEIPRIYDYSGRFPKSDFYRVLAFYAKGKPVQTIFATQDASVHRALRKPIANLYSMSTLVSFESHVNLTMAHFFDRLDTLFVGPGAVCDLGVWLQFFAWDVIGNLTFSKPLGFLESGSDVGGITANIMSYFNHTAPKAQMPWLDYIWTKNPLLQRLRTTKMNPVVAFALARAKERQEQTSEDKVQAELNSRDFLSRFMDAIAKDPSIPPWALTAWTTSNVTAGSDTTAIFLRTVFYYLLKYPATYKRLLDELDQAANEDRLSEFVSWKESKELPYLDAVIKEAGRMHPPFGLHLERVVPPEGDTICGQPLPGGTVIGISGWAVHRSKEAFGEDADIWRPERWLCDEAQRRKMERALLTFGAGNRVCLGKHISYLEMHKLVPTTLRRYQIEFADPDCCEWKVKNRWFVHQTGLNVKLKRRTVS